VADIALRAAQGSNNAGGAATITMTLPTGVADGDVMLMGVTVVGGTAATINPRGPFLGQTTPGSIFNPRCIAYGNGTWVIGCGSGKIITSTDGGANWSAITISGATWILSMSYGNGRFIGCCGGSSGGNKLVVSDDGVIWRTQTSPFGSFGDSTDQSAISFGNDVWLLGNDSGNIATSYDNGVTWTDNGAVFSTGNQCFGLAFGGGNWLAVGNNSEAYYSTNNGVGWTAATTPVAAGNSIYAAAYSSGLALWVITASNGLLSTATTPGGTWTARTSSFVTTNIYAVSWDPDDAIFVATGLSAKLATSSDGTTWTQESGGTTGDMFGVLKRNNLWSVAHDTAGTVGASVSRSWKRLGSDITSTTALRQAIFWRVRLGDASTQAIGFNGTRKASGVIIAFSGADLNSDLPLSSMYAGQANASSVTITSPALTLPEPYVGIEVVFSGTAVGTTIAPVTLTEPANGESASTGGSAASRTTTEVEYGAVANLASIVSRTATASAAAVNIGHHIFVSQNRSSQPYRDTYRALLGQ